MMSLLLKQLEIQKVISSEGHERAVDFNRLAENAWLWRIQYHVQCAHLIAYMNQSQFNREVAEKLIQETLFIATRLESLYERLNEIPAKTSFSLDKTILSQLLEKRPIHSTEIGTFNLPGVVQTATYHTDTARLFTGHIRRIFFGIASFPDTFGDHLTWTEPYVTFLGPILTLAGFLIYLPRSIVNSMVLIRRLTETQEISRQSRYLAHCEMDDRLFNLINDFPSVLAGFIAVFILTNTTIWLAVYITVAVKACEIIGSWMKNRYDLSRLDAMRAEYHQHNTLSEIDKAYLKHLDERISYIRGTRHVTFVMHALLLPCLIAFIPFIMLLHPAIPILAATFAIALVCLRFSSFRDFWINTPPPNDNLCSLSKNQRFFKPATQKLSTGDVHEITPASQIRELAQTRTTLI